MIGTHLTNPDAATVAARQAPTAMRAVVHHWLDHDLPAPYSIDAPSRPCENALHVVVVSTAADAWLDSLAVDGMESWPSPKVPGYVHEVHHARLPIGVRVDVHVVRRVESPRLVVAR